MSDLREQFERHQAGLLNIDYEELRDQFDRHEEIFGKRYVTFSDFEKEFELWQACWNHQQAIIDDLKAQLNNMEACYIEKKKQVEECAALAAGWNEIAWDKTTHWTEGYEEGCYHCSAQIEEALRGGS